MTKGKYIRTQAINDKIATALKGNVPWNKGLTKETNASVRRISSIQKDRPFSEAHKLALRKSKSAPSYRKGKTLGEIYGNERAEQLIKRNFGNTYGKANKGKAHPWAIGNKHAHVLKGRILSNLVRHHMSLGKMGNKSTKGMKIKPFTLDHRNKLSNSQKIRYINNPESHPNRVLARKHLEQGGRIYISKGQMQLYQIIKAKYSDAELEYPIRTSKGMRYADVGVPSIRQDFEYDGYYTHKTDQGKWSDFNRDAELFEADWFTTRVNKVSELIL